MYVEDWPRAHLFYPDARRRPGAVDGGEEGPSVSVAVLMFVSHTGDDPHLESSPYLACAEWVWIWVFLSTVLGRASRKGTFVHQYWTPLSRLPC